MRSVLHNTFLSAREQAQEPFKRVRHNFAEYIRAMTPAEESREQSWPSLDYAAWARPRDVASCLTQIAGKSGGQLPLDQATRGASPPDVTSRCLTTSLIP